MPGLPTDPDERRELARQFDRLAKVARAAEYDKAARFLTATAAEIRKSDRERSWPLGRCVWCQVDANRLREATVHDQGGGPPMCAEHFGEQYP